MQHHLADKQKWKGSIITCVSYYYASRNNWRSIRRESLPKLSASFCANKYRVIASKKGKGEKEKRKCIDCLKPERKRHSEYAYQIASDHDMNIDLSSLSLPTLIAYVISNDRQMESVFVFN